MHAVGRGALCALVGVYVTGLVVLKCHFSSRLSHSSTLMSALCHWHCSYYDCFSFLITSQQHLELKTTLHFENYVSLGIYDLQSIASSQASSKLCPLWLFLQGCSRFFLRFSFLLSSGLIDSQDFKHYLPIFSYVANFTSGPDLSTEFQTLYSLGVPLPFQLQHKENMLIPCSWTPAPGLCPW